MRWPDRSAYPACDFARGPDGTNQVGPAVALVAVEARDDFGTRCTRLYSADECEALLQRTIAAASAGQTTRVLPRIRGAQQ
jgi:hypothetical protein